MIRKNPKLKGQALQRMLFFLNNTPASKPIEGTPSQRYLGHTPKIPIPGSQNLPIAKEDREKILKARQDRQTKVLLSKQTSKTDFKIGDKVRIYNSYNNLWDITGEIIQEIRSEDGISRSFLIKDEDDTEIWINSKFIKMRTTQ